MRVALLLVLLGCGDKALSMTVQLPADKESWDTSCLQNVEVYTVGPNYPETDDYVGQTIDVSDDQPATYDEVLGAIRGQFEVDIPDSGLDSMEMYGWNGVPGWDVATSELVFFSRVEYAGEDNVTIPLVPNIDCRTTNVTVRPIDLIKLLTTKNCAMAAVTDAETGVVSSGTLSPGLYEPYLFSWGGKDAATVTGGVSRFAASTTVGPQSCLVFYGSSPTAYSAGCALPFKTCATGSEYEIALIDNVYAFNSIDSTIQKDFVGAIVGAVVDAGKNGIPNATVSIPPDSGKVVYVNLDAATKKLVPISGSATSASGMFIVYASDLIDVSVTANGVTKTARVGARTDDSDGIKYPAGLLIPF